MVNNTALSLSAVSAKVSISASVPKRDTIGFANTTRTMPATTQNAVDQVMQSLIDFFNLSKLPDP